MSAAMRVLIPAAILASGCRPRPEDSHEKHVVDPAALMAPKAEAVEDVTHLYTSAPNGFVDLVRGTRKGVVGIRSSSPVKSGPAAMFPGAPETTADVSLGTGFLIESAQVYAITTNKIASAAEGNELRVVLDDSTEVPTKVLGRDVDLDIAVLEIQRPRLQALPLGSSEDLKIGEWLVVLGNPFGEEITATAGIVSSTGKQAAGSLMQDRGMGYRTYRMFIQTDADVHRGNSGGPVIDTAGQVVGMAIATGDRPGELSFVLPIDRIREALPDLTERGQVSRSWLGAKVKPVTGDLGASIGLSAGQGAYITEVIPSSPAGRAELRAGDVILEWNGKRTDQSSLPWLVAATPAGKKVPVIVWRNKTQTRIDVTAERMPK
jgi:serine protease Do